MAKLVNTSLDFNNVGTIINLPDPALAQSPATKNYVDNGLAGLAWKDDVAVASTGSNINLSAPGATIDSVTMTSGMRFLAKDQTLPQQNGLYIWNGASSANGTNQSPLSL